MTHSVCVKNLLSDAQHFWLMKTEPTECSIDDALQAPEQTVSWFGVRNYQARNFMRDNMRIGDAVLFYHSSCPVPGIVGLARITSAAYPDVRQFDKTSTYFDAKSTRENPRWVAIDVQALMKCETIGIAQLRDIPILSEMRILQKGNRLSITPVTREQFQYIIEHLICVEK